MYAREVSVDGTESDVNGISSVAYDHSHSATSSHKTRFQMTFVPKDSEDAAMCYPWLLRCDTEEELEIWTSTMRDVSAGSFRCANRSSEQQAGMMTSGR